MTNVGAALGFEAGKTWAQIISEFEAATGETLAVRRCYDGAPVADVNNSQAKHDLGQRKSVLSIKPTMSTPLATLESFADSLVAAEHDCDVIVYHEPVDNMSGPDYIALYQRSAPAFLDTDIPVGVCYTNWSATFLPFSNGQSALAHYWPGDSIVDFIGFDEYPPTTGTQFGTDWSDIGQRARRIIQFADAHEKPLSLHEFAVEKNVDVVKAERWVRGVTDWALERAAQGMPLRDICYYHATNSYGSFEVDNDPEILQAYKDMSTMVQ